MSAVSAFQEWRAEGKGDVWSLWGRLIAKDREERPEKICHVQIGDSFKARAGGVGVWTVAESNLVDGHWSYRIHNDSLGSNFDMTVNFQWIRENLE